MNHIASQAAPIEADHDPGHIGDTEAAPACPVVLFGRDKGGKPHAAVFAAEDAAAAERAAGLLGFRVLRLTTEAELTLVEGVAAGRLFEKSGSAMVGFVAASRFAAIEAAPGSFAPPRRAEAGVPAKLTPKAKGKSSGRGVSQPSPDGEIAVSEAVGPSDWASIKVGSTILAAEEDAPRVWYSATVVGQRGPDLLVLKWSSTEYADEPTFNRLREHLALLPPDLAAKLA